MKLNLRPRTQPEVNLTSLIDVVLLLLIFFMVSTSFVKQSQISISLPEADSAAIVEEVPEQIDIMITETGGFLVNGRELINTRVETIRNALRKVSGGDNTLPLTISADANARHQDVVTAMDVAGRLGFTRISIATVDSPEPEEHLEQYRHAQCRHRLPTVVAVRNAAQARRADCDTGHGRDGGRVSRFDGLHEFLHRAISHAHSFTQSLLLGL